jgi:hypothetical protein
VLQIGNPRFQQPPRFEPRTARRSTDPGTQVLDITRGYALHGRTADRAMTARCSVKALHGSRVESVRLCTPRLGRELAAVKADERVRERLGAALFRISAP